MRALCLRAVTSTKIQATVCLKHNNYKPWAHRIGQHKKDGRTAFLINVEITVGLTEACFIMTNNNYINPLIGGNSLFSEDRQKNL